MRDYLYTYVHEAGHAFNLLHSWNKGRADALSWMNYPDRYDWRNGDNSYWSNFRFRFDDEELIHIRHGDRSSVIMGGDPWASGGHLEAPLEAMSQLEGETPIEFLLRSKENFEYMEPVVLEFRLRNLLNYIPVDLDTHLKPEWGGVVVYVRRPDGRILQYAPILCMIGIPKIRTLKPLKEAIKGEDRYSENIFLSYGKYGFYFDEPGEYLVRAIYQGTGEMLIPSNIHRVRVGYPLSKEEEKTGREFFTYQVGMNLYLGGSRSSHLSKGIQLLESVAEQYKDTFLGAKVATTLANSLAQPFFSYNITKGIMERIQSADPKKALDLTSPARALYEREAEKALNIEYHQLIRDRSKYLVSLGQLEEARKEITTLLRDLKVRGVNEPILNEIKEYKEGI